MKVSSFVCRVSSAVALEMVLRHASQIASFAEGPGVLTQAVIKIVIRHSADKTRSLFFGPVNSFLDIDIVLQVCDLLLVSLSTTTGAVDHQRGEQDPTCNDDDLPDPRVPKEAHRCEQEAHQNTFAPNRTARPNTTTTLIQTGVISTSPIGNVIHTGYLIISEFPFCCRANG